ncbi:E3 ubiquitin-protein ligase TRIM33-like [Mytilus californianus]|uniref:E3 ubiquitin-protein ligase TRIM33-like n=1 Tax=Mytilus californianus TaxID=6549 RepID=UPI002247FFF4|nr:E3 ubiquitin-protein ligase TRIM33-like [Mytilus californianus]
MASNCRLCGICDYHQIITSSVIWCFECDEGLCGDCKEYHSISEETKDHEIAPIADYYKLQTDVLQDAQVCKIHDERYELFCIKHDCLCCKKCVQIHTDCKDLTDINEIIKNVKTSNAFYEIEQTLLEVVENIERISGNREDNLTWLKNKKREIEAEVKQTRTKINHHLDKLQDDLMKDLITTEQNESSKIKKVLTTLKRKEKEIAKHQANFVHIKQHSSELNTFLFMKQIEKDIAVEEKFIESIIKNDFLNQTKISCEINKSLHQLTASIQKFGEMNISSDPCGLSVQKRKNSQAQIMVALPTRIIDNLTVTLQKRITTEVSNVRGCSILPDGRMVFSSFSEKKVSVLKSDGLIDFEISNIGGTFDVVFIGNDCIAVTSSSYSNEINIIDIKKKN